MYLALTKKSRLKFSTTIISSQLAGAVVNSGLSQSGFKALFCHLPNLCDSATSGGAAFTFLIIKCFSFLGCCTIKTLDQWPHSTLDGLFQL